MFVIMMNSGIVEGKLFKDMGEVKSWFVSNFDVVEYVNEDCEVFDIDEFLELIREDYWEILNKECFEMGDDSVGFGVFEVK